MHFSRHSVEDFDKNQSLRFTIEFSLILVSFLKDYWNENDCRFLVVFVLCDKSSFRL